MLWLLVSWRCNITALSPSETAELEKDQRKQQVKVVEHQPVTEPLVLVHESNFSRYVNKKLHVWVTLSVSEDSEAEPKQTLKIFFSSFCIKTILPTQ